MASFNPFHWFRKHQKVLFAVLTILCMFIFVLQFGTGDFFQRAKGWFGAGKGKGEFVAKVNGTKVTSGDLGSWATQRRMTNTFILYLRNNAVLAIAKDPRGNQEKTDPRLRSVLEYLTLPDEYVQRMPQQQQFNAIFGSSQAVQALQNELKDKPGKEDERKYLDEVAEALKIKQSFLFMRSGDYFGPANSNEALLDFELWKHQADKLGIVLTPKALRQVVQHDTAGRDVLPEGAFLANQIFRTSMAGFLKTYGNAVTEKMILDALSDEYRAIMAQEALVGQALTYQGAGGMFGANKEWLPVTSTPGEYLQYFREQRTTVKAALLPIPVQDFEKEVTATPTPTQLRDLYERYKNEVPAPANAAPGFMEPRSVRIQYLTVNANSEHYQDLAKKFFAPSTAMTEAKLAIARQVLASCGSYPTGGGAAAWALTAGTPLAGDAVLQQYGDYFGHFQHSSDDIKRGVASGDKVAPDIYDPSYDAASALGHILSGVAQGNPAAAPAAILSTKRIHTQAQARGIGAVILAGTSPAPGLGSDLQTVTNYVQPMDKLDSFLVERTRDSMAKALVFSNLIQLSKGLEDVRNNPAEAEKFIEKIAKEDGFHLETMTTAKNSWSLSDDPALKDLREAFTQRKPAAITTPEELASEVLKLTGVYQLGLVPLQSSDVPPQSQDRWVVYWLVENNPAKVRSFEAAKDNVIAAWKHGEARKLARKKAEEIAATVQKKEWPSDDATRQGEIETALNDYKFGKAFVLNKIARQVESDSPNPDRPKEYQRYQPKETEIKYAPDNFADRVVGLQKPGDATYLQNRPETMLYVVVLLTRTEPTYDDFKRSYARASESMGPDSLWTSFVQSQREEFTTKFLEKMREDAAPEQVKNGQWDLPKDLKPLRGSRNPVDED